MSKKFQFCILEIMGVSFKHKCAVHAKMNIQDMNYIPALNNNIRQYITE